VAALSKWLDEWVPFWTNQDRVVDILRGVLGGLVLGTVVSVLALLT
jgi:hypothetical protein